MFIVFYILQSTDPDILTAANISEFTSFYFQRKTIVYAYLNPKVKRICDSKRINLIPWLMEPGG